MMWLVFVKWFFFDGFFDVGIVMIVVVLFFVIFNGREKSENWFVLFVWDDMKDIFWGILVLFGGGLSLVVVVLNIGLV